jgi:hypothetical protein
VNDSGTKRNPGPVSDLVAFDEWLVSLGRSKVSGWRYRKLKMIPTVNLMGRLFVSRAAIAEFERRVLAGEFAKTHCTPRPMTQNSPNNNESTTLS